MLPTRAIALTTSRSLRSSLHSSGRRTIHNSARVKLLKQIYTPFQELDPKSPEYKSLAISGKCWEQYFDPGNAEKLGYTALQKQHLDLLQEIDALRASIEQPTNTILENLVVEYAHQSVAIEGNNLKLGDTIVIREALTEKIFKSIDISTASTAYLKSLSMPTAQEMLPRCSASQVAELRNHIIASQWVALSAPQKRGTVGLSEHELCDIAALMVLDTDSEALYSAGWGGRYNLGQYRRVPIQVRSNPLRVFPYPPEVPTLMQNFLAWRNDLHERKATHPLILACHSCIYFLSIHPFIDGNGRVGRTLLHDYMVRQGYFPIVMQGLDRKDYLQMVSDAADGKPEAFVEKVIITQLDMLRTLRGQD
ncbi:fic/DOC family protein [Phaeosphaeriaceae sp. PMI808]|nr:fic/DOC family protein [Phaeosphaeriaceae sp. PMI808]